MLSIIDYYTFMFELSQLCCQLHHHNIWRESLLHQVGKCILHHSTRSSLHLKNEQHKCPFFALNSHYIPRARVIILECRWRIVQCALSAAVVRSGSTSVGTTTVELTHRLLTKDSEVTKNSSNWCKIAKHQCQFSAKTGYNWIINIIPVHSVDSTLSGSFSMASSLP